jgi:peptide/nickel transport system ATP-binding protein
MINSNERSEILRVENLTTVFHTQEGIVRAVEDVSFSVFEGQTLGIVGESGCGKSVTSLSIMRLIQTPPGKIEAGKIFYRGQNILEFSDEAMRKIRGNKISMIFQEPMTALNPVFTIGDQINEVLALHRELSAKDQRTMTLQLLQKVGIPEAEERIDDYPHQLSGGMRQRVMMAMALACEPQLLIADEPTTALDVTIQAQILELLRDLQKTLGMAMILITHDLGIVAETADYLLVMYAGKVVEQGPVQEVFSSPRHPYTRGLLKSLPTFSGKKQRLESIPGIVPNLLHLPQGCRFQDRCSFATEDCKAKVPELRKISETHAVRCLKDL